MEHPLLTLRRLHAVGVGPVASECVSQPSNQSRRWLLPSQCNAHIFRRSAPAAQTHVPQTHLPSTAAGCGAALPNAEAWLSPQYGRDSHCVSDRLRVAVWQTRCPPIPNCVTRVSASTCWLACTCTCTHAVAVDHTPAPIRADRQFRSVPRFAMCAGPTGLNSFLRTLCIAPLRFRLS